MEALSNQKHFGQLAISLNASTDEQRSELMPINRKYPLKDLLAACRRLPLATRGKITFEYVLIRGLNDSTQDALRVARMLKEIRAKINLILSTSIPKAPGRGRPTRPSSAFARS